jgi:hypothetical protein
MPYTLSLPATDTDAWILHHDLLGSAQHLCKAMLEGPDKEGHEYLKVMLEIDTQAREWVDQILVGCKVAERS